VVENWFSGKRHYRIRPQWSNKGKKKKLEKMAVTAITNEDIFGDDEAPEPASTREASDEEEADDSEPMTLRRAAAPQALNDLCHGTEPEENERIRPYLQTIESMVREIEAMAVSARSHQSDVHDHFLPPRLAYAPRRRMIMTRMLLMIRRPGAEAN
jgi:hypothetical protein